MSVSLSYFSNVFYKVFKIRHEEEWYFIQLVNNENKINPLQPLFGLTCFVVVVLAFTNGGAIIEFMSSIYE
jgi:hypothetical protein